MIIEITRFLQWDLEKEACNYLTKIINTVGTSVVKISLNICLPIVNWNVIEWLPCK